MRKNIVVACCSLRSAEAACEFAHYKQYNDRNKNATLGLANEVEERAI